MEGICLSTMKSHVDHQKQGWQDPWIYTFRTRIFVKDNNHEHWCSPIYQALHMLSFNYLNNETGSITILTLQMRNSSKEWLNALSRGSGRLKLRQLYTKVSALNHYDILSLKQAEEWANLKNKKKWRDTEKRWILYLCTLSVKFQIQPDSN